MAAKKTAMVLAAGFGKRLRPLTLTCPKPLLPVAGKPILHRTLELLAREGFSRVIVNLHHLGDMIRQSVGDGSKFGIEVLYSEEKEILGTGGGIKTAQNLIGNETFLVINGDVVHEAPLSAIWEHHKKSKAAATLALMDAPDAHGFGAVKVDESQVRQILDKPPCELKLRPMLFTGIHIVEPVFFEFAESGKFSSSTQDVYPAMISKGLSISFYEYKGLFLDIGDKERYSLAQKIVRS